MTVLKWSAPFALAIALAASPAMAEETPHATVLDHRVREANYNDRQVYEIPGVFRITTEIVFAKDEVVEHVALRSEEHTSELQSLMRISYAVFCLKKNNNKSDATLNNT